MRTPCQANQTAFTCHGPVTIAYVGRPWHRFSYVPRGTARELAKDLAAAGIPPITEHGKAVFHSLRITSINLVLDLGVNPKEAQQLVRHST